MELTLNLTPNSGIEDPNWVKGWIVKSPDLPQNLPTFEVKFEIRFN